MCIALNSCLIFFSAGLVAINYSTGCSHMFSQDPAVSSELFTVLGCSCLNLKFIENTLGKVVLCVCVTEEI